MALAAEQLLWLFGAMGANLIIMVLLLVWLYKNREGKKMFPSKTITIRDGHHYVDMNPSKTAENIKFFVIEDGETIQPLKIDKELANVKHSTQ